MKTNTNVHKKVNLDISGPAHKDIILLIKAKPARVHAFMWKTTQPV